MAERVRRDDAGERAGQHHAFEADREDAGALNPLIILPAGLFFGFLETGAFAMQRAVGVPTPLVAVIQGLTMIFILSAMGLSSGRRSKA